MAIVHNITQNETGSDIIQSYTWTARVANEELHATTFIDISDFDDFGEVDRLVIEKVWITAQFAHEFNQFNTDWYAVYLLDSANVPLLTFSENSSANYNYSGFGGYDTKSLTPNANGDLKIAMGSDYNPSNGQVSTSNNVNEGAGFTITVQATKIYK